LGWGLGWMTSRLIVHKDLHTKQQVGYYIVRALLMHKGITSKNGFTRLTHNLDLGEATTFLLIIFSMFGHGACTQLSFCLETPKLEILKFSKLRFMQLWRPIAFCVDLWLRWGLKQICSPCRNPFNNMCHATYMQLNQGDSWLLMVGSHIATLIPDLSFDHNLCFKYPNGSCKPNLNI